MASRRQWSSRVEVVLGHAGPGHGEAGEHPDGVEGDELVHLGPGDQAGDGDHGEDDDPGGEDQPVAPLGQLAGQVGVLGGEAGEEREAGEAGVAARMRMSVVPTWSMS